MLFPWVGPKFVIYSTFKLRTKLLDGVNQQVNRWNSGITHVYVFAHLRKVCLFLASNNYKYIKPLAWFSMFVLHKWWTHIFTEMRQHNDEQKGSYSKWTVFNKDSCACNRVYSLFCLFFLFVDIKYNHERFLQYVTIISNSLNIGSLWNHAQWHSLLNHRCWESMKSASTSAGNKRILF